MVATTTSVTHHAPAAPSRPERRHRAQIGWLRIDDDGRHTRLDAVPENGRFAANPSADGPVSRVALAYDGSTNSRAAIEAFARLPFARGTAVTVVGVQEPAAPAGAELTSEVTGVAERLRAMGIDATTQILHGHPPEMIASFVQRARPDLLVLGAPERPRRAGSIAESIARAGDCHVLVARAA